MSQEHHNSAAARIGSALANVAAGAAKAGAPGAIAGAVKSFWPELVKGVVVILCVMILLPFLLFCALPNILFGFNSAKAEDIIAFNDQASAVTAYYGEVDAATQARIDELIGVAVDENTKEDGSTTFDLMEVSTQVGNISPNWFIAINSVRHQQNLFEMDKPSILEVVRQKIYSVWSLISRTIGEGANAIVIWVLHIEVRDRTPEALMNMLGFTEQQKLWAGAIRETLEDDQRIDVSGVGEGYDFSDFSFTEVTTPVTYYNQLDKRWCNTMYGPEDTIGAAGCGPTTMAMAVATFADPSVTPVDVADWSAENGYCCPGNGSYHSLIPAGAAHYGLGVEGIGLDTKKLVDALERGDLVICLMARGHFTRSGHYLLLRGITDKGMVLVADSASSKRSNQEWDLSIFPAEARRNASAGGPFWVISRPS